MFRLLRAILLPALGVLWLAQAAPGQFAYNLNYDYYPRTNYYPMSYSLYGWSGWGVPPLIQADVGRGMAIYAQQSQVQANASSAAARAQVAQAVQERAERTKRWNTFFWAGQHGRYLYRAGGKLPKSRDAKALEAQLARLRDRPEVEEIEDGSALNAVLDQVTDPRIPAKAWQSTRTPLDPRLIQQIPFEYSSEVVALLFERITSDTRWPRAMTNAAFAQPRRALREAAIAATQENRVGPLSEEKVKAVHEALRSLAQQVARTFARGSPLGNAAEGYLKELVGVARLLGKPDFQPVLAALNEKPEATVEDLIGFMEMFNLRFGPAQNKDQAAVYHTLYTSLSDWRNELKGRLGGKLPQGGVTLEALQKEVAPALQIFATMSWDQLIGKPAGKTE